MPAGALACPPPEEVRIVTGTPSQDRIEVRNRFDGGWSGGYQLEEVVSGPGTERYRVRRCSDGWVFPTLFERSEVRRAEAGFVVDWQLAGAS